MPEIALLNCCPMVIPLRKTNLALVFIKPDRHTRLLMRYVYLWRVDLLNLAILIRPDLKMRSGCVIPTVHRFIGILNQQLILTIAIKVNELGVSKTLGSIRIFIEPDSLALAVLLLVLENLIGEQLICRLDRRLGRRLGLLLGLRELDILGGVEPSLV